jgi:4'-phosphopantetheinyl transferase
LFRDEIGENSIQAAITSGAKQTAISLRECPRNLDYACPMPDSDEVHIWYAYPAQHYLDLDTYALLSRDEQERMARFRFDTDRDNFLFYRSMLRLLLASYLDTPPAKLCFAYSAHGKPSLAASSDHLEFNVSHSHGIVLFAFNREGSVGVDVEHIRRDLNVREIAGRFFSTAENCALTQCADMYDAFFHCWTRKEAFVKARGEGLSCPLDSFDVSVAPEDEEVSLTTRPDAAESQSWQLRSLNSFPEYAAAVVVESSQFRGAQF